MLLLLPKSNLDFYSNSVIIDGFVSVEQKAKTVFVRIDCDKTVFAFSQYSVNLLPNRRSGGARLLHKMWDLIHMSCWALS